VHLGDRPHGTSEYDVWLHTRPDYLLSTGSSGYVTTLPYQCAQATAVEDEPATAAAAGGRLVAAPNPFNPRTRLSFTLPAAAHVSLAVHDLRGRRVRQLVDGRLAAGTHDVVWNGRDRTGRPAAAGVYLVTIEAGRWTASARVVMVR
jgi:hypothetical protein